MKIQIGVGGRRIVDSGNMQKFISSTPRMRFDSEPNSRAVNIL